MGKYEGITLVHTWRDGTYLHDGTLSENQEMIGALAVAEQFNLDKVLELRHLRGAGAKDEGAFISWEKDENGEWKDEYFGNCTEAYLLDCGRIIH